MTTITDAAQSLTGDYWIGVKDGDRRARALFRRHYSYQPYKDARDPVLFVGPGEKLVLMTLWCDALFVWRKFISGDGQQGINCAVFRNESAMLSSLLILEAEQHAFRRWGEQRLYTYVNPRAIQSSNPGYCFKMAGWRPCGLTKWNKLLILEKLSGTTQFS